MQQRLWSFVGLHEAKCRNEARCVLTSTPFVEGASQASACTSMRTSYGVMFLSVYRLVGHVVTHSSPTVHDVGIRIHPLRQRYLDTKGTDAYTPEHFSAYV